MNQTTNDLRRLTTRIDALATSDGAGVRLLRSLGSRPGLRLDPFLMLDEFGTENPDDYIAGFPPHPHRGFETVTYMLDGHMRHEDHLGNRGDLGPGGVQWMSAGRGIIHSEMPQQTEGRMRGFQLWINLPAAEKMKPAAYSDIQADAITAVELPGGGRVKLIAGTLELGDTMVRGPINTPDAPLSTDPRYLDVVLPAGGAFDYPLPAGHNALLYVYEGEVTVGDDGKPLPAHHAGLLSEAGARVQLRAGAAGASVLLLAGRPLHEPVAQYGPFVMNTREEIEQALADYRDGRLTAVT